MKTFGVKRNVFTTANRKLLIDWMQPLERKPLTAEINKRLLLSFGFI